MQEKTPQDSYALQQGGALLVDVRERDEYAEVHASGAQLLPLSEFQARYQELPKDRQLLMICRSGKRSAQAGEFLLSQGYSDVINVAGGTLAWVEADLPHQEGHA